MADAKTTLRVQIVADLADIKQGMGLLRGELAKVKRDAASVDLASKFNSFKASIAGIAGAAIGFGGVFTALRAIVANTVEAERAQAQLAAALASSGGAAGLSAGELNKMATELQRVTTFDDDAITGAQTLLAQFDKIGRETFPRATKAVLDFAQRMSVDLNSAAVTVGKALQDPETGLKGLRAAGVDLSESQKKLVHDLEGVGASAQAQAIVLDELEKKVNGAATAARDTLGGALAAAKVAFGNLLEGDTGTDGARGAVRALNDLTDSLNSSETKEGFQNLIQLLVRLAAKAGEAAAAVGGLFRALADEFSSNEDKSPLGLLSRRADLVDRLERLKDGEQHAGLNRALLSASKVGLGPDIAQIQGELAGIEGILRQRRALLQSASAAAAKPPGYALSGNVVVPHDDALWMKPDAAAASARAQAAAEAQRAAAAAAKDYQAALAAVNDTLERQASALGGPLLAAAQDYRDTLEKLADAEAVLQKQGKLDEAAQARLAVARAQAGEAYQAQLQALQSRLPELQSQLRKVNEELQLKTAAIAAQEAAGFISAGDAERQLQVLRATSIEQLQHLREATQDYLGTLDAKNPDAAAAADFYTEISTNLANVQSAQDQLRSSVMDQAEHSLFGFFMDLATATRSFKEAFAAMVLSFIQGLAQMAAEALAKQFIFNLFKVLWPGAPGAGDGGSGIFDLGLSLVGGVHHTGGVVGHGAPRTINWNPSAAVRMHTGGIVGLGPNEEAIVAERGEEMLTRKDPRHRYNGGLAQQPVINVTPIVVFSEDELANALAGHAGERVVVTHARANWSSLSGGR